MLRDFGVANHGLLFHEEGEGTLLDKMFVLMYASDLPPNLKRAAIVFEEGKFPTEVITYINDSWHIGLPRALENLVREKFPKTA